MNQNGINKISKGTGKIADSKAFAQHTKNAEFQPWENIDNKTQQEILYEKLNYIYMYIYTI